MPEKKICKQCGSPWVVNQKYSLCEGCNFIRLHGISKEEVRRGTIVVKVITSKPKARKLSQKVQNLLKREKFAEVKRLDFETYRKVFDENPHECEECGAALNDIFEIDGEILNIWQYSHIASKAAYPEFRHNSKNFNRLCLVHHNQWEFGNRKVMKIYVKNIITINDLINDRLHTSSN